MNVAPFHDARPRTGGKILKLAILAVGGQGGGVLSDWIVGTAERSGFRAQSTSVAGVAQRTGATIYYVEMAPDEGRQPIFALSPAPGDVDILIAAELMEAGRAILRGFVTPERTTLIASTHRIAAVSEKIEPGDGRAPSQKVEETARLAAKNFIAFDMERIAVENGSMISASLLGALAASGALPFARKAYEDTIGIGGRGAKASLAAFAGAFERASRHAADDTPPEQPMGGDLVPRSLRLDPGVEVPHNQPAVQPFSPDDAANAHLPISGTVGLEELGSAGAAGSMPEPARGPPRVGAHGGGVPGEPVLLEKASSERVLGPENLVAGWQELVARVAVLPEPVRDMAGRGLRKVVDYQDLAYGGDYLGHLDRVVALDRAEHGFALSLAAAKHLANAFCYDDIIRVADLKTRSTRETRVRKDVALRDGNLLRVTEYFHPRVEEFCGTLPAGLGRFIEARPKLSAWLDRRINHGRHIRTDGALGYSTLWLIAGLRRWRRKLLRHQVERKHLTEWYDLALSHVPGLVTRSQTAGDYALAVEILNCRRLIKGYSDTHVRGRSKFDRVLSALPMVENRPDAADWLRRLREAALKDEKGEMLDGALRTVASL